MRSLLADVLSAFSNQYSGWILWNLFLAFIPLVLSIFLFRPTLLPKRWLWASCGLVGLIGVLGIWPKLPDLVQLWIDLLRDAWQGMASAQLKLGWFLVVIIISLILSYRLFRHQATSINWLWWLGFALFIAFLPNAPYVLTDIIHLIRATGSGSISPWAIVLVFIPTHIAAILLGFEAYVMSLINQAYYLKQIGLKRYILPSELLMHGLSALGIYLGRFIRLNSWDFITDPSSVLLSTFNTLTSKRPIAVMVVTFIVLTVLYWLMKQITLGLKLRLHYARMGMDALD